MSRSPRKGRAFSRDFHRQKRGIEAVLLDFQEGERSLAIERPLGSYYFRWKDGVNAILFGYGSLYNHSYFPNAVYRRNYENHSMDFVALHDIRAGQEITINYNGKPDCRDPLWFHCCESDMTQKVS
jgi:SET domain-containing protein